jgi:5-methylcytosine-specific restriction endonuclease McrA
MMRNYNDPLYKDWRKKIYARDKFTCQWPGCKKNKGLQAHHIYKWSDFPGLRYHPDNGITLCREHHKQITSNEEAYVNFFNKLIMEKKNET